MDTNFTKSALALALATILSGAAQAASIELLAPSELLAGQQVELQLLLKLPFEQKAANDELLFYGFKLDYDASLLRLTGFSVAPGWDDDSAMLGAAEFGASHFPGLANTGQDQLALGRFSFELLGAGSASLQIFSQAGNFSHGLGYAYSDVQAIDLQQTLAITAAVPEPDSAWLALGGLLAIAVQAARRRSA